MSLKTAVWLGMFIGSIIGGYVPMLFGVGLLSFTAIITSTIGGIIGVLVAYKLTVD
ncbi:MAG: hypothetical protein Q8P80_03270 [Candidatus Levybacteria bacterium]|nr:hypothetical protein [Candidatus Levybacteria bacterium]